MTIFRISTGYDTDLVKKTPNVKVIFGLTLVHFIGDFYLSFIVPLLPVFAHEFSLTLAQIGLLAGISRILGFIVQPSVGYLSDRYRTRLFVLAGPFLASVFIPLVGVAPCFSVLLLTRVAFLVLHSLRRSCRRTTCVLGFVFDV